MSIKDHKGNEFSNVYRMCYKYKIDPCLYLHRYRNGMTMEEALTTKPEKGKKCMDHEGNYYKSLDERNRFWGVTRHVFNTYHSKKSFDWMVEKCSDKNNPKDHLGNKFDSIKDMCKFWNISGGTYHNRVKYMGMTVEEALTTKPVQKTRKITDHLDNTFQSVTEMCTYWNISTYTYYSRTKLGWSLEEALTKK